MATIGMLELTLEVIKTSKRIRDWERRVDSDHLAWDLTTISGKKFSLHSKRELEVFVAGVFWNNI